MLTGLPMAYAKEPGKSALSVLLLAEMFNGLPITEAKEPEKSLPSSHLSFLSFC